MQVEIAAYGPFKDALGGKRIARTVEEGTTVGDCLRALAEEFPAVGERALAEDGSIGRAVTVTLDGTPVRQLAGEDTELSPGSVVGVTPPVKGGSENRLDR